MTISASPRNVAKSARGLARYGYPPIRFLVFSSSYVVLAKTAAHPRICRSFAVASSALKSARNPKLPSSPKVFALVVVSAPRSALSTPLPSSTCPPTSKPRSPTDTPPTASSSTDCLRRGPVKCWALWVPTVSERVPH
ncbi:hypothetical protein F4820DRAFT_377444 [Hypoxylon rubiginosum]|uniref:Uncharacterized protein n=1 Tax=Hypoxylon rubiginosum TaxID=110542 RepID=A0ACB9YWK5_9PEZI|nr:hypothetical protein F4820DRAFT_377444 [Hypoxylon rubiginosum]